MLQKFYYFKTLRFSALMAPPHFFWINIFKELLMQISWTKGLLISILLLAMKCLTLKILRRFNFNSPAVFFPKIYFLKRLKVLFFMTFNIIRSHIFPGHFIKIPLVVQKIWRFSSFSISYFHFFGRWGGMLWDFFVT